MRLSGERTFAAPREVVWSVLTRPEALARTLPGVEQFEIHDDEHWTARVRIPLGLVKLRLTVEFELTERHEPELARLHAHGRGAGGSLQLETSFELSAPAEAETRMRWQAEVALAGPAGSVGTRLLRPLLDHQVRRAMNTLDAEIHAAERT